MSRTRRTIQQESVVLLSITNMTPQASDLGFLLHKHVGVVLKEAGEQSSLPEAASARAAMNDLLVRVRLKP